MAILAIGWYIANIVYTTFNFFLITGMWAHSMTVQDYQDLLNRGWRRCVLFSIFCG